MITAPFCAISIPLSELNFHFFLSTGLSPDNMQRPIQPWESEQYVWCPSRFFCRVDMHIDSSRYIHSWICCAILHDGISKWSIPVPYFRLLAGKLLMPYGTMLVLLMHLYTLQYPYEMHTPCLDNCRQLWQLRACVTSCQGWQPMPRQTSSPAKPH